MKLLLIPIFFLLTSTAIGQKKYQATYRDTTFLLFLGMPALQEDLKEKGLTDDAIKQLMGQLAGTKAYSTMFRNVRVNGDSTVVAYEKSSRKGNVNLDFPDSLLMLDNKVYVSLVVDYGFSKEAIPDKERSFLPTGQAKKIMNHSCTEYISNDSTLRIWVAEDMATAINPGMRVGKIKGAVFAFEHMSPPMFTKCELIKLE